MPEKIKQYVPIIQKIIDAEFDKLQNRLYTMDEEYPLEFKPPEDPKLAKGKLKFSNFFDEFRTSRQERNKCEPHSSHF